MEQKTQTLEKSHLVSQQRHQNTSFFFATDTKIPQNQWAAGATAGEAADTTRRTPISRWWLPI